ncbi:MAG: hypothetical protein K0R93_3275 [Anaerosolibacter sp.]|jgi:hypothetical protein|uniref:hypothetical protein n=1 Tax=Anaerosolibacter sp. TaxID=1872527 RepID=UPI002608EC6E|nr:hypothetical protein [Anaerosolibacter sp.]MDF2548377.1 hypothetical protein [Anaerosolibacter sp.]
MRYLRERHLGLYVLIVLAAFIFQLYLRINPISNLQASFRAVHFESSSEDPSIKELRYMLGIKNSSNQELRCHAVIVRPKADWYPYLDSIPEKYYSDLIIIPPDHGEFYEIEATYNSPDDRITGGSLGDFRVEFITEDEYQKVIGQ